MNPDDTILDANVSSLKLLHEGSGEIHVPGNPGPGIQTGVATIPHGYGSSELLFQVATGSGYLGGGSVVPFYTNDGRLLMYGRIDSTNLYIVVEYQSAGDGWDAFNQDYSYRIFIP